MALTASARIVDGDPIDIFERRQHLGAQFGVEHRAARTLVDETIGRHGDDQKIAELAGRFEVAHMAEMQQIECAVRLDDGLPGAARLLADRGDLVERSDLFARAGRAADRRLPDQLCDA